tara:strand:- start:114 stop:491 length:378 start_codon:yes stop_codon:yes gene_type:complete
VFKLVAQSQQQQSKMRAIDRAVNHFDSIEVKKLEVEEWSDGESPFVIYAKPLTLKESQSLYRLSKNDDLALLAHAIISKSLDEDGNKHFTLEDKVRLMNNVDVGILTKIGTWIMGTDDLEDAEKK